VDELSPIGPNLVREVSGGRIREFVLDPLEFGIPRCAPGDLAGGTPEENGRAIRAVFEGAPGPKRDAVLLNAAGALLVAGVVDGLRDGVAAAREVIDSGAAGERLEELAAFSRAAASGPERGRAAS
jgi:anthranilate phosphoribosyltransferase